MDPILQAVFLKVFNMSITASYVIAFVIVARFLLQKTPKVFSYALWIVVLFRLICPFSFSAAFSLLNAVAPNSEKMEYISPDITMMGQPQVDTGINSVNAIINPSLPAATPYASVNPMQIIMFVLSIIWILGVLMLLIYSVASYLRLKQRVRTAMLFEDNIFECENISTPFVLGIIKPKIYLPVGLSETEKSYIVKHEQIHIRRFDYVIKPLAFLVLCVHWFNPLVWLSFALMSRDMEMSCDEEVIKELGTGIKKDYSTSLLALAVNRKMISGSPLAFGETGAKQRIKNVLNYQRPAFWAMIIALVAVVAIGGGLVANPQAASTSNDPEKVHMAETWAQALKTRDGKPRYQMMSQGMKVRFVAGQKQRAVPWNFNIGFSSPWVVSYEVSLRGNTVVITYHLADSGGGNYKQREILTFGQENNQLIVTDAKVEPAEWERVSYFASSARQAMEVYTKALRESDYNTIMSLTHAQAFDPKGKDIWDTIKISSVKVINEDVRDNKACYELELDIKDGGDSAFEQGIFPRWLWLVKDKNGWYAEGLMTSGPPEASWWAAEDSNGKNLSSSPGTLTNEDIMKMYITDFLTKGYSKHYVINSIKCEFRETKVKDAKLEAIIFTTMNYYLISYKQDPDTVPYIRQAKEKAQKETNPKTKQILQKEYETMAKEHTMPFDSNYVFKLTGNLVNGKIDVKTVRLFLEGDGPNGLVYTPAEKILPR